MTSAVLVSATLAALLAPLGLRVLGDCPDDGRTITLIGPDEPHFWSNFTSSPEYLDGAPDPKVAFGDARATDDTILAHLKSYKGAQSYKVPAHLNPADFKRVYIWCRRYSVPLGYADLKAE